MAQSRCRKRDEKLAVNTFKASAGQTLAALKQAWDAQKAYGFLASYMMHGQPGVGKTQIAESLARYTGGKLYDIRLTTIETSDLRGLPYYNHETKQTMYYRPEDLPSENVPAVLFLDELTSAAPHLQPTVYGLLQERRIGQHRIPDSVMIVAAGNGVEDGAVAYEMGTAISDRLIHLNVVADPTDWVDNYAVPQGLHPAIVTFVKIRPDLLQTVGECLRQEKLIATTPRSWERASQIMFNFQDRLTRMIFLAGTLGDSVANEFMIISDDIEATVQVDKMIKAQRPERIELYPTSMHGLNAMILGVIGSVNKATINACIEILIDLASLSRLRKESDFKRHPLKELATFGLEQLFKRAISDGLMTEILANSAYQEYEARREAEGLSNR